MLPVRQFRILVQVPVELFLPASDVGQSCQHGRAARGRDHHFSFVGAVGSDRAAARRYAPAASSPASAQADTTPRPPPSPRPRPPARSRKYWTNTSLDFSRNAVNSGV